MKNIVKIAIVVSIVLAAVTGCELYQAVNVGWSIDGWSQVGTSTRVSYTVHNLGKLDLTGVNLKIGVDVLGNGTYPATAWTPDFDIRQNEVRYGTIDVPTGPGFPAGGATVLSVDMDNPPN
jgi:hypothetical protein